MLFSTRSGSELVGLDLVSH